MHYSDLRRRGEIVEPGYLDQLLDRLQDKELRDTLRVKLKTILPDQPEMEMGRMVMAGVGAAIGSAYKAVGAGAGGAAGALLYEMLKERYWEQRRR